MKTTDKPRETFAEIQCIGTPVMVKGKLVGFAPVPEVPEVSLEALQDVGFSNDQIASLAYRMAGVDIRNKVAGKYASTEASASKALSLISDGSVAAEEATEYGKEHSMNFTQAVCALGGLGEDALASAKADKWHWDVMKSVVK